MKCLNYKEGKKTIFAQWNDKSVILKAKHLVPTEFEILGHIYGQPELHIPSIEEYMQLIRSKISDEFGIHDTKSDEDVLFSLWTGSEPVSDILLRADLTPTESAKQLRVMRSLWSLVQQNEYLFLQYFNDNPHLAQILGSCGHVYGMEYAPSTSVLEPDILHVTGVSQYSWHERVKIAFDLLNVLKSMQNDFHEPLHFCDVKGGNFGISQSGKVKPIDTDTVFFRSKIDEIMTNVETCRTNADCDFFDCKGQCNVSQNKCHPKVMNDNFEVSI